jgi:polysaccharide biosynthesis transport protein
MVTDAAQAASGASYFAVVRRRFKYVAIILPTVLFLCIAAAFAIHPRYQATATIMLEASSVPKDIIESTVLSYSDHQIEIVQGRVMTPEILLSIVKSVDPYPERPLMTPDAKAQKLLEDTTLEKVDPVTMKPAAESNAFSLHYDNRDPAIAVTIDERLGQLFLQYNQRVRSQAAGETAAFLKVQSEQLAQQMREVDAQVAAVKSKFGEALPDALQRNQATIDDTQRQLDGVSQQVLLAQGKESMLSTQLNQMSPNLISQSGDLTDIATVRAKLNEAEQRYTQDHPEVKRLKRALTTLMAQGAGSGPIKKGVDANNPQYQLMAAQLNSARDELANLKALAAQLRAKMESYRGIVARTPGAEREISEVLRRREVLQNQYQHAQDRLQSANLAETFESGQGGERFTLLRAPTLPHSPVYPNRLGLILLGLVVGLGLSGAAVAVAESMDRTLRVSRDAGLLGNVPVLANIPFIDNSRDKRRRTIMFIGFGVAYSAAAVFLIGVILNALRSK